MNRREVKRIAIVGFGSIGRQHLRILKKIRPNIEVILVRSGIGNYYPEEVLAKTSVSSIEEVLKMKLDGAIISSPAPFHIPQATKFLAEGIPLLIEKPISNNLTGIKDFKALAKNKQVPILVGFVLRYSKSLCFFNEMLLSGRAGKLTSANIKCSSYLPSWRPNLDYRISVSAKKDLGGGVLHELSHELDYANWIFGPFLSIKALIGNSGKLDIDVEDEADLKLLSSQSLPISIHLSFCRQEIIRRCIIQASEGTLVWDGVKNIVSWKPNQKKIERWSFNDKRDLLLERQLNHFFGCIEQNDVPLVSLNDGISALNLVMASKQSYLQQKIVKIQNK